MKMNYKKGITAFAAVTLAAGLNVGAITTSQAVDLPKDVHITLISPTLTADNTSEAAANQKMANGWVGQNWFGSGLIYQRAFAPVGSTINLVYHVTDKDGKPMVGQSINLRVGKGYSKCTAVVQVDSVVTKGECKEAPLDLANVKHKTDAYGNVSFVMKDLDTTGEKAPAKWTDEPNISPDGLDDVHMQVMPIVDGKSNPAGEQEDHSVITEFHYYTPAAAAGPATKPTIRMTSPELTDTNSIHRADLETQFSIDNSWYAKGIGVRQAYVPTGSTMNVVYHVADDNKADLAGISLKLHVNKAYSGSNAKITDGKTATDATKDDTGNNDQALLTADTDAFGNALYVLTNTDTKGEAAPATMTTPTPLAGKGAVFSQLFPELTGATTDIADMSEFHFYGDVKVEAPKPTTTGKVVAVSASAAKGKVNVVISNASGKSAKITVSGGKTSSVNVSVSPQQFSFAATRGAKVVTVVIAGKTYKSTVNVK